MTTQQSEPAIFELVGIHNRITLDNVYFNGMHALRHIKLRNLCDKYVTVKMRSNLRRQIVFQLHNENLPIVDNDGPEEEDFVSNTVAASTVSRSNKALEEFSNSHFNQLFNYVNHIDEVELQPFQTKYIVLALLPNRMANRAASGHIDESDADNLAEEKDAIDDESAVKGETRFHTRYDPGKEEDTYNTFEVNGMLFFFGYKHEKSYEKSADSRSESPDTAYLTQSTDDKLAGAEPDYQLSVKFRSTVCQSVLWTDISEVGLNFDDCVVGGTYFKDFTISNKSEIDLFWLLNTVDINNANKDDSLRFTDYDTGEVLDNKPIPSYSHRRVRVTFKPKEVGEFNYDLQVENVNDSRNLEQTRIHASVRSVLKDETLVVSSGNVVDFGDCCAGAWTTQQLVLRNVSELPMDVHLASDGAEMYFDIKSGLESSKDMGNIDKKRLLAPRLLRDPYSGTSTTNPTITPVASISELSGPNSEVSSRASSPTLPHSKSKEVETSSLPVSIDSLGPSVQSSLRSPKPSNLRVPSSSTSFNDDSDTDAEGTRTMKTSESADESSVASAGNTGLENFTRIEDIIIRAGSERRIQVSYRPEMDNSPTDFNAGQLMRRNFRIVIEYGPYRSGASKERKVIQCKARSCTSFVEAIPREINFGDTDVGALKSLPVNIFNRSDIPARVELQFNSKVLNCQRGEISIPPRSLFELKLDMYPRKVNADYRKQLTLVNYLNRKNDQIIEVRSTNIDKNRVTFHSLFYRILTATGANFIDFGPIALNSPALRTFTIDNISNRTLKLEVTTSLPDDFVIYTRKKAKKVDVEPDVEKDEVKKLESEERPTVDEKSEIPTSQSSDQSEARKHPNTTNKISTVPSGVAKNFTSNQAAISAVRQVRSNIATRKDYLHSETAYLDLAIPSSQSNMRKKLLNIKALNHKAPIASLSNKFKDSRNKETSRKMLNGKSSSTQSSTPSSDRELSSSQIPRRPALALSRDDSKNASSRSLGITAARHKSRKNLDWSDITGMSRVPFDDLIAVLEHCSKALPPLFPKQSVEEKFVRHQMAWRHELERLIEKEILVASKQIEIEAGEEEEVIIVFTPDGSTKPHIQNTPRKQDARIFLRLIEFDRSIEQTQFESLRDLDHSQIPLRELIVRSHLCRSVMDLGQKNINFGLLERNERRTKSIILHNRSETSLLYTIRKSGSIASGDIMLGSGRHGVVRAFGKREIDFVFEPTLPGQFMERLVVENIRDRENDQVVLVKANVRKPSTFFIKSLQMNFGVCFMGQLCSRVETIVITNTNKQSRTFEIRTDPKEMQFDFCTVDFDYVVEDDNEGTLTKEQEEEIETLEQKLKIARRKGHADKVKKYLKKLAKLKKTTFEIESNLHGEPESERSSSTAPPESDTTAPDAPTDSSNISPGTNGFIDHPAVSIVKEAAAKLRSDTMSTVSSQTSQKYKRTANSVIFSLDAHATKTISVYLKPVSTVITSGNVTPDDRSSKDVPTLEQITGRIFVHEHKNTDICKKIVFTAQICRDQGAFINNVAKKMTGDEPMLVNHDTIVAEHVVNGVEPGVEEGQPSLQADHVIDREPEMEPLSLERAFLDCGRLELDQPTTFYLNVANRSQKGLYFEVIIDPAEYDFFNNFEDVKQLLKPEEQRKVIFPIVPKTIGLQQHHILLRNVATGSVFPFTVQCMVHRGQYLRFPSLGGDGELDLGYSYVDPGCKYSQVTPLLVENITDDDLYISCQSNLSQQVVIFQDENIERGQVERMFFKRKSMTTVWVAVQPNLLSGYLNTSGDECRELVGGIKFGIYMKSDGFEPIRDEADEGEYCLALQQTVKFTSLIGQSNLEVSDKIINMGYTDILGGEFYGHFTIKNKSGRLPLDYEVECSSSNIVVDRNSGTLDGWRMSELKAKAFTDANARKPSYDAAWSVSATQITFKIYSTIYGLLKEKITIINKYNSMEVFDIEVRLFVDCGTLKIPSTDSGVNWPSDISELSETSDRHYHRDTHQLPVIKWEDIYVRPLKLDSENVADETDTSPSYTFAHDPTSNDAKQLPSFEVENMSEALMHLTPLSDLTMKSQWNSDDVCAAEIEPGMPFHACGPALRLTHNEVCSITVYPPSPEDLSATELEQLSVGERGSIRGLLVLYDAITKNVIKVFDLEASFCASVADLSVKSINIGKIGHATSWKPMPFYFAVRNLSDIMLRYTIEAPSYITLEPTIASGEQSAREYDLAPMGQCRIEGVLDPKACEDQTPGLRDIPIRLINKNNSDNVMVLTLRAQMTIFELGFERLNNNSILLPVLSHPLAAQNVPCDNWFTICNTTDDDTKFEIGAEIAPDLKSLIKLNVLSRYSNTPLKGGFTLNPRGKIEIRVRAYPIEDARLPVDRPDLLDPSGIDFAKVWVSTRFNDSREDNGRQFSEEINVRGVLSEVPMFSLSERRLEFKIVTSYLEGENSDEEHQAAAIQALPPPSVVPEFAQLSVTNLSQKQALRFKVTLEGPVEFSARKVIRIAELDGSGIGIVEPGASLPLSVEIIDPKGSLSGQFRIHIDDMDSVHGCRQTTTIYVIEDRRKIRKSTPKKKKPVTNKLLDQVAGKGGLLKPNLIRMDSPASVLPYINLRGCKRIDEGFMGGRYELDLGQLDMGSNAITKKLTLENTSDSAVSYRIRCIPDPEREWLKISRSEGTLESLSDTLTFTEPHTVTLSFSTAIRNIYLTYLIIENIDNPIDTKTIRVTMEVVARQNVRRGQISESENNNVFDVFVNGIDISQTCIDMLNIFYGSEYTARSMLIYNRESVPLEFTIMSNLLHDDPTEILFSTSQSATRLFKSLTVEPKNHIRVYIRFRPLPSKAVRHQIEERGGDHNDVVEHKTVEIYINCRLVKDYQQTVLLKAECRMPAFRVAYHETQALMGTLQKRKDAGNEDGSQWDLSFPAPGHHMVICNLQKDPMSYQIVNDTSHFLLEFPDGNNKVIPPGMSHKVIIKPNMKRLLDNAEAIHREKYLQEYVTVYNKDRPQENYWIPLRMSFGHVSNFQLASGYRSSHAYSMLESHVVSFLKDFNAGMRYLSTFSEDDDRRAELEFKYYYIVDQLVYYSTVKTGENFFQLASLLFCSLLKHDIFKPFMPSLLNANDEHPEQRVWPEALRIWVFSLHYFLSFFPQRPAMLETLRRLYSNLVSGDHQSC
ncbi:hypothetical protein K450DRAFT_252656 [Umbelopsis ramanniana AG]|uniref:Uncharacterized protein n=1 Tax=Umbelopsis ramanniana AG TaxID=1314678 RepID=A0AAD5E6S1_UMBRA|nr:uncharacterized protein K450DRAFT_252656 [Umbelopsis ramanniana AG]KAI8577331.1 hypothetical protein K450DRAFT_252656 [Umbelopsis ramanniana AG]